MTKPALSIVIATHNRHEDVRACLAALQTQPELGRCQVLLIDSASTPSCSEQLQKAVADDYPFARYHRVDTPGVSLARNVGAELSQADWFATLDDDAIPHADWVAGALSLTGSVDANVGVIQGRVNPLWPTDTEPQLGQLWRDYLSIVQRPEDTDMTLQHACAGANMLIKRAVWSQIGGYNTDVGRKGNTLISGIDTDLSQKVVAANYRILYSNRISVRHKIHKERLTKEWIAKRAIMEGRAQATTNPPHGTSKLALMLKLSAAIPVLHALERVFPERDDWLVKKNIDIGLMSSLIGR